jgi:phage-related protein
MSYPTLPNIDISYDSSDKISARVMENQFGDGYKQTAVDGINTIVRTMDVLWASLTLTDMQTVTSFLETCAGSTPFYWQPPEESLSYLWRCKDWNVQAVPIFRYKVTATFIQAFDIASGGIPTTTTSTSSSTTTTLPPTTTTSSTSSTTTTTAPQTTTTSTSSTTTTTSSSGTSISFVQGSANTISVQTNSINTTLNNVTAGDLIVVIVGMTGGTTVTVSDGTSNLTALSSSIDSLADYCQIFYSLSANSGTRTYTATTTGSPIYFDISVLQFHATSGTWVLDVSNQNYGSYITSMSSGPITTTGTKEVVVIGNKQSHYYAVSVSNPSVNGQTPVSPSFNPVGTNNYQYYYLPSAPFTGAFTITYAQSTYACCNIAAFKISGS